MFAKRRRANINPGSRLLNDGGQLLIRGGVCTCEEGTLQIRGPKTVTKAQKGYKPNFFFLLSMQVPLTTTTSPEPGDTLLMRFKNKRTDQQISK